MNPPNNFKGGFLTEGVFVCYDWNNCKNINLLNFVVVGLPKADEQGDFNKIASSSCSAGLLAMTMTCMKKIWFFILVILAGAAAGILSSGFLMPYLSHTSLFEDIGWLKEANNGGTTIINKTEQVIIEEGRALENAIDKINPSVVGIVSQSKLLPAKTKKTSQAIYGTGFIATSDGLILTANSAAPEGNYDYYVSKDNQSVLAQVVKRDASQGLVLLKINETNLPVVSFGEINELRLGQRIVLVGADASANPAQKIVNFGIIKSIAAGIFSFSLEKESQNLTGAPLIDVAGDVIGAAQIDSSGKIKVVSSEIIKKFLGQ